MLFLNKVLQFQTKQLTFHSHFTQSSHVPLSAFCTPYPSGVTNFAVSTTPESTTLDMNECSVQDSYCPLTTPSTKNTTYHSSTPSDTPNTLHNNNQSSRKYITEVNNVNILPIDSNLQENGNMPDGVHEDDKVSFLSS